MRRYVATILVLFLASAACFAQERMVQPPPTSTGVVVPDRSVTLAAKIIGRVKTVSVEEGDRVDAGDVLVDIADAELRANLAAAEARVRMEELNWSHQQKLTQRVRSLREQGTVSEENLDDANYKADAGEQLVASARAEAARAKAMLDETKIRAPFAGVVIRKNVESGDVTAPGEPLLIVEDHSTLKFRTSVKEQDIAGIRRGQTVNVTIDALDNLLLEATVTKIIPSGHPSTHEFVVEAVLPQRDNLYPGMFGKAEFTR